MLISKTRRSLLAASIAACLITATSMVPAAHAAAPSTFPEKTVTIYVGFPPGTSTDTIARILGEQFSKRWGQPVVVENKPGVGGSLAAAQLSRAKPDGYTLILSATAPMSINPYVYDNVGYDPLTSFVPIGQTTWLPYALVVRPDFPAKDFQSLIAMAKKDPGKLTYASIGMGTTSHLIMAMLEARTGAKFTHVPYKGSAQSQTDIIGGNVDMTFDTLVSALPMLTSNRLRALAVSTAERTPIAPEIPTLAEQGQKGFDTGAWLGFFAPAGTPAPVVDRVFTDLQDIMKDEAIRTRLMSLGSEVRTSTSPKAFGEMVRADNAMWGELVRANGVRAN